MSSSTTARVKQLTLIACILATAITFLDSTVVGVALPTIQRDLGGGLAAQQWVSNAYLLTLGSLILLGGSLGDVLGERRVFSVGVACFGVTSLLCALSPSIDVLIAMRALQGVAGALLMPSALAVIVATFDESERGAAIGTWTAWGGIATVLGPLAGGELLAITSWRVIFLINIPLVMLTLALIRLVIPPRAKDGVQRHLDWPGAALAALGLAGPVFALIEQPRLGWSAAVLASLLGGLVLLALFLLREARARDPMLPLSLFRRHNFSFGNIETFSVYAGLSLFLFILILFLQQIAGYTPLQSGLATLPVTVIMFFLSRFFGNLSSRYGPRLFMGSGPLIAAAGLALMLSLHSHVSYLTELLPALLIFSVGLSLTVAPLTTAILADVGERQAGIASAVNNAVARIAGLLITAAIGALLSLRFDSSLTARLANHTLTAPARKAVAQARKLPLGLPSTHHLPVAEAHLIRHAAAEASVAAFHLGMLVTVVLLAVGGLIGLIWIRDPKRSSVGPAPT